MDRYASGDAAQHGRAPQQALGRNDDAVGTFSFSQPVYAVDENGPYADITVIRDKRSVRLNAKLGEVSRPRIEGGPHMKVWGVNFFRMEDGKVRERWGQFDVLGMVQQLGLAPTAVAATASSSVPPATTAPTTDTHTAANSQTRPAPAAATRRPRRVVGCWSQSSRCHLRRRRAAGNTRTPRVGTITALGLRRGRAA